MGGPSDMKGWGYSHPSLSRNPFQKNPPSPNWKFQWVIPAENAPNSLFPSLEPRNPCSEEPPPLFRQEFPQGQPTRKPLWEQPYLGGGEVGGQKAQAHSKVWGRLAGTSPNVFPVQEKKLFTTRDWSSQFLRDPPYLSTPVLPMAKY